MTKTQPIVQYFIPRGAKFGDRYELGHGTVQWLFQGTGRVPLLTIDIDGEDAIWYIDRSWDLKDLGSDSELGTGAVVAVVSEKRETGSLSHLTPGRPQIQIRVE